MYLIIENLGAIKKAKIDLRKKFYLFVGYNNTGKTHLSQILWGIFDNNTKEAFSRHLSEKMNIEEFLNCKIDNHKTEIEITKGQIENVLSEFSKFLKEEIISDLLNIDENEKFMIDNLKFSIEIDNIEFIKKRNIRITSLIGTNDKEYKFLEINKKENSLNLEIFKENIEKDFFKKIPENMAKLEHKKTLLIINFFIDLLFNESPFYLPATRLFYSVFYKYILRLKKEESDEMSKKIAKSLTNDNKDISNIFSILSEFKSTYTKPMDKLTTKLAKISEEINDLEEMEIYNTLIEELKKVIGGDIVIKSREGIGQAEFYLKIDENKELPMFLSSSSVNQLTTLYLFFKYWAEESNNFLILDEPEENLHPQNQINLIDILVNFKNMRNRVLLTTHSSLIAECVNSYLHLGYLKEKNVDIEKFIKENKINMNTDNFLTKDDTAIYAFEKNRVIDYEIDDYGAFFRSFKDSEVKIRDINEKFTDKIYELEDE